MRRTLQTAYLLFGNHPNFKNIKFIVHPDLREGMSVSCDVPTDIRPILDSFKSLYGDLDVSKMNQYIE